MFSPEGKHVAARRQEFSSEMADNVLVSFWCDGGSTIRFRRMWACSGQPPMGNAILMREGQNSDNEAGCVGSSFRDVRNWS